MMAALDLPGSHKASSIMHVNSNIAIITLKRPYLSANTLGTVRPRKLRVLLVNGFGDGISLNVPCCIHDGNEVQRHRHGHAAGNGRDGEIVERDDDGPYHWSVFGFSYDRLNCHNPHKRLFG
jgi:hypothetical protein